MAGQGKNALVAYPAKLVKRFPELKRALDQLDGLELAPPTIRCS
jgi:hypothetical protein